MLPWVAATWKDLGVVGEWASVPVSMHGYTEQSGTRSFLRQFLLADGAGRRVTEHASHAELVEAVAADRGGVGVVSLSRVRPDRVRAVPLAGRDGRLVSVSDQRAVAEGRYPLIRSLKTYPSAPALLARCVPPEAKPSD